MHYECLANAFGCVCVLIYTQDNSMTSEVMFLQVSYYLKFPNARL